MKFIQLIAFTLTLIGIVNTIDAQTGQIKGKIRDAQTLEVLPFAHVFVNATTLGAVADVDGNYTLANIPQGTVEIVFSYIGYNTFKKTILLKEPELILDVMLTADEKQLDAVQVSGTRDKEWNKQLKKFERIFLGTTKFSKLCRIVNPWVLDFEESQLNGKKIFIASNTSILEIENNALGYRIYYHLKSFNSTSDSYNIKGEIQFEPMVTSDQKLLNTWSENRENAYFGSLRHLLKSLINNNIDEDGYKLFVVKAGYGSSQVRKPNFSAQVEETIIKYPISDIVSRLKVDGEFNIRMNQQVEVHYTKGFASLKVYNDIYHPVSWIQVQGGSLKVNSQGIVLNPSNLIVSGEFNQSRIADLLPNDFVPSQSFPVPLVSSETQVSVDPLAEKVYIQTDKDYYYAGEKIWFKAYLNYKNPAFIDSLSQVLYVELINSQKQIAQTRILKIEDGVSFGDLALPLNMPEDSYYLRAYTNWMLNYSSEYIFVKSLPVLKVYEKPVTLSRTFNSDSSLIKLISGKASYSPRSEISLEFEIKNSADQPIYADLSVSVTDTQLVFDIPESKNITVEFPFKSNPVKKLVSQRIHNIERGISLEGQYQVKNGKPQQINFVAIENQQNKIFPVETDKEGRFWITGFQFEDTTVVSFRALDRKSKITGTFNLIKRDIPKTEGLVSSPRLNIEPTQSPQRIFREVVPIKELPISKDVVSNESQLIGSEGPSVYGKADFTVGRKQILQSGRVSLIDALRARVPGLLVIDNAYIRIGGVTNFTGPETNEPLLIIDDAISNAGTTYNGLSQINPETVDRVEVIKYSGASIYGTRGSNGIILVYSLKGDYQGDTQSSIYNSGNIISREKLIGYSKVSSFPVSATNQSLRLKEQEESQSTLLWAPRILTDKLTGRAQVSFYAPDKAGKYKVLIEGVDDAGDPLRGLFYINVVE